MNYRPKSTKQVCPQAKNKAQTELNKLKNMAPMSAEATVVRSFVDWMLNIPWSKRSRVRKDLAAAQEILDADHYGLTEVKERIIEYLAVQNRVSKSKSPVLCLVGPPGVGKTSLGEHREGDKPQVCADGLGAAYVTKPKSAGTAEPTLVPCRARLSKRCQKPVW